MLQTGRTINILSWLFNIIDEDGFCAANCTVTYDWRHGELGEGKERKRMIAILIETSKFVAIVTDVHPLPCQSDASHHGHPHELIDLNSLFLRECINQASISIW
jgi:hypothetical protein